MALLEMEGCTKYRVDTDANRRTDLRARMYFPGSFVEMGTHPLSGRTIYDNGSSAQFRLPVTSGDPATVIVGGRFRAADYTISDRDPLITFYNQNSGMFTLQLDVLGGLYVERDISNRVDTAYDFRIEPQRWYYIEMKVFFDNTTGTYEVKVDGQVVMSGTNADTLSGGGPAICRTVFFGLDTFDDYEWADMYVLDTTGSSLNDYLGDIHIETVSPDGDGNRTDWTPDSGLTNYTQVDEANPDRDSSYIESSTAGDDDLYTFAALTIPADTVLGVMVTAVGTNNDAGRRILNGRARSSTFEGTGNDMTFHDDRYRWNASFIEQDPNGPAAWTETSVNAAEFGVTLTT